MMVTAPRDITCQEMVELVTDYVEGALPEPDRARFEQHLSLCDGCGAYLAQIRETIRMAGMLTEASIPPDAREALLAAFRTWKHRGAIS